MSFGNGHHGRLGHSDREEQHAPKLIEALRGKKVLRVSAGGYHSLVLLEGGGVMSFGHGSHGRLGHGDEERQHTPMLIEALRDKKELHVSAGGVHSLVLLEGGGVMSFGDGECGRLGLGGRARFGQADDASTPELIAALRGKEVTQVSAGRHHSLVLLEGGGVMSFGCGRHGQLGHTDTVHSQRRDRGRIADQLPTTPPAYDDTEVDTEDQFTPKVVAALVGKTAQQVSAGDVSSLVKVKGGVVVRCGTWQDGKYKWRPCP